MEPFLVAICHWPCVLGLLSKISGTVGRFLFVFLMGIFLEERHELVVRELSNLGKIFGQLWHLAKFI
jgi:hypothetical protein